METILKLGMINVTDPQKGILKKLTLRTNILQGCSWKTEQRSEIQET